MKSPKQSEHSLFEGADGRRLLANRVGPRICAGSLDCSTFAFQKKDHEWEAGELAVDGQIEVGVELCVEADIGSRVWKHQWRIAR